LDADFYLADLLSKDDTSIKEKLLIVLQNDHYKLIKAIKKSKVLLEDDEYFFKDKQKAYKAFWSIYRRPPLPVYWDSIINRKDLLVPQDIRERKGSYFTPPIWANLSQKYIADVLGDNWQDEYYIWDCCAGTGNLLVGINKKIENVFASTIDEGDVKVMHDLIENGAKLLKKNVFQFDFLNDDFKKLPKALKDIIDNEEKRKKLLIYINPPYAEAPSASQKTGKGKNKSGVSNQNNTFNTYIGYTGKAINELFVQFICRIYNEIKFCKLGMFSKLKFINSQNFIKFREYFKSKYMKGFICPSNTFENVKVNFPIAFSIWNNEIKNKIKEIKLDIYDLNKNKEIISYGKKMLKPFEKGQYLTDWIRKHYDKEGECVGVLRYMTPDFQNNSNNYITNNPKESDIRKCIVTNITKNNIEEIMIYLAIRQCIEYKWINDRDQYLHPNDKYVNDIEFINNCFIYILFHGQNKVTGEKGINHWIPFTEKEVNSKEKFKSNFMSSYLSGNIIKDIKTPTLFDNDNITKRGKIVFSFEAKQVYDAGLDLWKYYHSKPRVNINASLYDIKGYFQGFSEKRMNNKSDDEEYNILIGKLREKMKILAKKIEPKVYEYGFLLK